MRQKLFFKIVNNRYTSLSRSRQTSRAFTLIEMLVVIAILLILMTVVMPTGKMMMRKATEVQCASDIRTLGMWTHSWSSDNDGRLPDLNIRPSDGRSHSQYSYWTWTEWRDIMTKDYGLGRELFYSASNDVWNRDDFWDVSPTPRSRPTTTYSLTADARMARCLTTFGPT